jgi:hypothetical protein
MVGGFYEEKTDSVRMNKYSSLFEFMNFEDIEEYKHRIRVKKPKYEVDCFDFKLNKWNDFKVGSLNIPRANASCTIVKD